MYDLVIRNGSVVDGSGDPAFRADVAVQGNMDPLLLLAGGPALEKDIDRIVSTFAGRPHVFNLGHGILPPTPIAHVERLMARLNALG